VGRVENVGRQRSGNCLARVRSFASFASLCRPSGCAPRRLSRTPLAFRYSPVPDCISRRRSQGLPPFGILPG
jgi:hypothetical protein